MNKKKYNFEEYKRQRKSKEKIIKTLDHECNLEAKYMYSDGFIILKLPDFEPRYFKLNIGIEKMKKLRNKIIKGQTINIDIK